MQTTARHWPMDDRQRRRALIVSLLILAPLTLTAACGATPLPASPAPAPTPTPSPTPAPSSPTVTHLTGRVTDEGGSPLSGVLVEVDYSGGGGTSNPPSNCPSVAAFCWLMTRTNGGGYYEAEFVLGPKPLWVGAHGYIYTVDEGYSTNVQPLQLASDVVQNLRLRRPRQINVGESIVVTVEPDSSLCSDLEDLFAFGYRCEYVRVAARSPGTLKIEMHTDAGGLVPTVFWTTSGNYSGPIVRSSDPAAAFIPISGGVYNIMAGIAVGAPSQLVTVSTSMR